MPVLNIHNEEAYDNFTVEGEHGLGPRYVHERLKDTCSLLARSSKMRRRRGQSASVCVTRKEVGESCAAFTFKEAAAAGARLNQLPVFLTVASTLFSLQFN